MVTGRGGMARATCGVKVLRNGQESCDYEYKITYNSYSLFMTSFSIPSIALSNSASDAFFHTSHSRMPSEMNCDQHKSCALRERELVRDLTFRKSLMSLT